MYSFCTKHFCVRKYSLISALGTGTTLSHPHQTAWLSKLFDNHLYSLLFRENRLTCHILFKSWMGHSIRVYYMLNTKLSLYPYPLAATPAHHSNNIWSTSHVCRVVSEHCFTSLFAQSWQYRDRRKPVRTISYCYRRFKGSFSCTVL